MRLCSLGARINSMETLTDNSWTRKKTLQFSEFSNSQLQSLAPFVGSSKNLANC